MCRMIGIGWLAELSTSHQDGCPTQHLIVPAIDLHLEKGIERHQRDTLFVDRDRINEIL